MNTRKILVFCTALIFILGSTSCSLKKMVLKKVANTLTASKAEKVFTGDNDPELVGQALPFALKMYESLLVDIPSYRRLRLRIGSLYVMYAHAFLDIPSRMLTSDDYVKKKFQQQRAKNLYLRGRDILLETLEKKYPGFRDRLDGKNYREAVQKIKREDIDFLYWIGAGWMGAMALEPLDVDLGMTPLRPAALMERALDLDENYGNGVIHDSFILYYGSMPDYMGGDEKKAREHFSRSVKISGNKSASPYIYLAITVARNNQDREEFKRLLETARDIDLKKDPENALIKTLNRRRATWLLKHMGKFFL